VARFDSRLTTGQSYFSQSGAGGSAAYCDDDYHVELWQVYLMDREASPVAYHHVYALAVVEVAHGEPKSMEYITPEPIKLQGKMKMALGLTREVLTIETFRGVLRDLEARKPLVTASGTVAMPALSLYEERFSPAAETLSHELNGLLKSNVFSGGYVQEYSAMPAPPMSGFITEGRVSSSFDQALRQIPHFSLAALPDRLGNLLMQFRTEPLAFDVSRDRSGDLTVRGAWHPYAPARPVHVVSRFDDTFGPVATAGAQPSWTVQIPMPRNYDTWMIEVQDADTGTTLCSHAPLGYFGGSILQTSTAGHQFREVHQTDDDGFETVRRVSVISHDRPKQLGPGPHPQRRREAQRERLKSARTLEGQRKLVSYAGDQDRSGERGRALSDIEALLNNHGKNGAWLWDPYLAGKDIIDTLALCRHKDSDLRALSDAKEETTKEETKSATRVPEVNHDDAGIGSRNAAWIQRQRTSLQKGIGQSHPQIDLTYLARVGQTGWSFHDRFLIFPQGGNQYLVWSLGASVNGLGKSHHVLVEMPYGDQIAGSFLTLWNALDKDPHCQVWPIPADDSPASSQ